VEQVKEAGPEGQRIFMLSMLPELVDRIVSTVEGISIDKISVIDSGNGQGVPSLVSQMPSAVIRIVEQIETATGVDILRGLGDNGSQPTPATLSQDV
jgi:flotillin